MAEIGEVLYRRLINTAALTTALGGQYVYPVAAPQGKALPYVTLLRISNVKTHAMQGDATPTKSRYQVSTWSTSISQARALAALVDGALRNWVASTDRTVHRVFYEGEYEVPAIDPDMQSIIHHIPQDFIVWWS